MKKILVLVSLVLSTLFAKAQTFCGPYNANCTVIIDPDTTLHREWVMGYNRRFQDIQTFSWYQLHEAADMFGNRAGYSADIRSNYQTSDIHSYDTLGNSSQFQSRTDQNGSYGNMNAFSFDLPTNVSSISQSYYKHSNNTFSSLTNTAQSKFYTYADEVNPANSNASISVLTNSSTKGVVVNINPSFTGPRFLYSEIGTPKKGMGYGGTGYVTQLHSLVDKEYSDLSVIMPFSKTALPSAALPNRIIFVTNATGGACPAYNDGTNWRRFSDNSIIN